MALGSIHHVSINVRDLNEALLFYCDLLELPKLPRPDLGVPGAWLEAGSQQIHLMEMPDHKAPPAQHFAFQSQDIDADVRRLRQRGIEVSEPRRVAGVCRQCFFKDPSGNLLELNQPEAEDG